MSDVKHPELWEHQKQCVAKAGLVGSLALFLETGTGKTGTAVHILRNIYNTERRVLRTLVFAPPVVVKNWKKEIALHSKIPLDKVILLQGSGKKRIDTFLSALKSHPTGFIAVTNYESVQMKELYEEMLRWQTEVLICDESHRLKNPSALRTKAVIALSEGEKNKTGTILRPPVKYAYILTGTPVLNSPMDLFSQFRVLDHGATFGKNFFAFRAVFFYDKNAGMPKQKYFPNWVPKPAISEKLGQLIERRSFQARKSECLTLPPLVRERIEVELGKEQKKAYEEILKNYITFVKENAVVADLAITKTLRLQQILSGFVRTEDGEDIPVGTNPRIDALGDLLEDLAPASKIIVWCNFKRNYADISALCARLGLDHVFLTGEQSTKEKEEAVERFRRDPLCRVVIGNPKAGGVGITLVESDVSIYYTRSYSLEDDIQSEARNYRGGSEQHKKVTRIDIVAPGTLDELVLQALENKQNVADAILDFARGF